MVNISSFDRVKPARTRKPVQPAVPLARNSRYDMIVFSHLRWDFVYQRPQHIISRLAADRRILLVEEPLPGANPAAELEELAPNLHRLHVQAASIPEMAAQVERHAGTRRIDTAWFYSPAFVPLLEHIEVGTVVYDCMDELSLFKGAANELPAQEARLLERADVVFTGGSSLYESKRRLHANVHCFPSSVDAAHFALARGELDVPADIAAIPGPIAGYTGVIDERIDLGLLAETARQNPAISFVMIGPLAKIGEDDLPRAANLHYLGMKPYAQLPNYLRAFTVAIMPFASNDSTRFISPTKTLEYMAAGKPVISTPIRDVERHYSHCVRLVNTPAEFGSALAAALADADGTRLEQDYADILASTSWDSTVARMKTLLERETVA